MTFLLALALTALTATSPNAAVSGRWDARLVPTPEFPVAFGLEISKKGAGLEGALVNGSVRTPFTSVVFDGKDLVLSLAHYDATIVARPAGEALEGRYERTTATGKVSVPFSAVRPPRSRETRPSRSFAGSWGFEVGQEKSLGLFTQKGGVTEGTLLTTTGDEGVLHGTFDGTTLVLTAFDGVHIYRYDGTLEEEGLLAGEFRSRANPPVPFRARRLSEAEAARWLPGAFTIVRPKDPAAAFRFALPDAAGRIVSSEDYRGRPMIVTIMGTWCPNCADEAPLLAKLDREWRGKGLAIVELAFEYTDDSARFRKQAARYAERHGISVPVLLAGTTAAAKESAVIEQLEGWEGYPTTLFLDREHRIVAAHSGFEGPATGARHEALRREIESRTKALLEK